MTTRGQSGVVGHTYEDVKRGIVAFVSLAHASCWIPLADLEPA